MPRRLLPMKDAATLRKALGTSWQRAIQGSPNGATPVWQQTDPVFGLGGHRGN
jgi:hypothetical protein